MHMAYTRLVSGCRGPKTSSIFSLLPPRIRMRVDAGYMKSTVLVQKTGCLTAACKYVGIRHVCHTAMSEQIRQSSRFPCPFPLYSADCRADCNRNTYLAWDRPMWVTQLQLLHAGIFHACGAAGCACLAKQGSYDVSAEMSSYTSKCLAYTNSDSD